MAKKQAKFNFLKVSKSTYCELVLHGDDMCGQRCTGLPLFSTINFLNRLLLRFLLSLFCISVLFQDNKFSSN